VRSTVWWSNIRTGAKIRQGKVGLYKLKFKHFFKFYRCRFLCVLSFIEKDVCSVVFVIFITSRGESLPPPPPPLLTAPPLTYYPLPPQLQPNGSFHLESGGVTNRIFTLKHQKDPLIVILKKIRFKTIPRAFLFEQKFI
jgi:hypothetical protein